MRAVVFLLAALLSAAASAQNVLLPELQPLQGLEGTPAFRDYWRREVMRTFIAYEYFSMAALAAGCDRIPQNRPLLLIPEYREAIRAAAKTQERILDPADPAIQRWTNRANLFAYNRLSAAEKASLRRYLQDQEMLKYLSALTVLEDFFNLALDPRSGAPEPAAVIALKSYFRREGELESLRKAIDKAAPELLQAFDKVGELETHSETDAGWLSRLDLGLLARQEQLIAAYTARIPTQVNGRMSGFQKHVFHRWVEKAGSGRLDEKGYPNAEAEQIYAELETKYPQPPELKEKLLRMGPYEHSGGQIDRFCPPEPAKPAAP